MEITNSNENQENGTKVQAEVQAEVQPFNHLKQDKLIFQKVLQQLRS